MDEETDGDFSELMDGFDEELTELAETGEEDEIALLSSMEEAPEILVVFELPVSYMTFVFGIPHEVNNNRINTAEKIRLIFNLHCVVSIIVN